MKAPETEPPATKPVPKPTISPILKEDNAKEPPSETIILEDMSLVLLFPMEVLSHYLL